MIRDTGIRWNPTPPNALPRRRRAGGFNTPKGCTIPKRLPITRDEIPKNSGTNLPANLRRGKPFQPSHDPRRNVTKGGRPPDEFKALMRALVTEQAG